MSDYDVTQQLADLDEWERIERVRDAVRPPTERELHMESYAWKLLRRYIHSPPRVPPKRVNGRLRSKRALIDSRRVLGLKTFARALTAPIRRPVFGKALLDRIALKIKA